MKKNKQKSSVSPVETHNQAKSRTQECTNQARSGTQECTNQAKSVENSTETILPSIPATVTPTIPTTPTAPPPIIPSVADDYLEYTTASTECTGLEFVPPQNDDEEENYNRVFPYLPPDTK